MTTKEKELIKETTKAGDYLGEGILFLVLAILFLTNILVFDIKPFLVGWGIGNLITGLYHLHIAKKTKKELWRRIIKGNPKLGTSLFFIRLKTDQTIFIHSTNMNITDKIVLAGKFNFPDICLNPLLLLLTNLVSILPTLESDTWPTWNLASGPSWPTLVNTDGTSSCWTYGGHMLGIIVDIPNY